MTSIKSSNSRKFPPFLLSYSFNMAATSSTVAFSCNVGDCTWIDYRKREDGRRKRRRKRR
jgi:hypothetical protein